jgi:transcriptional regulator with XRE-family HTH domain
MNRIKQFRTKNKITQQNIADTLGITQQQWFKYEKEVNELPIRYLEIICKVYGISANWLLGLVDEPETL